MCEHVRMGVSMCERQQAFQAVDGSTWFSHETEQPTVKMALCLATRAASSLQFSFHSDPEAPGRFHRALFRSAGPNSPR